MKLNAPVVITTISVVLAATSLSFGVAASRQRKIAEAEVAALRKKIAQMPTQTSRRPPPSRPAKVAQEDLANTNELVVLQGSTAEPVEQKKTERPQRESWEDRIARMKEEDPEGYAEMIKRREEFQETIKYNLAERTATFMDLDTANMTEEERASHELLVEKMATIWALTDQFNNPEQPPDRDAMRELFAISREVRPLMDQERTIMFKQLGTDLGYEGGDAQDFATHVEDIISATSLQSIMPSGGGRGGSSGGRGGGGR